MSSDGERRCGKCHQNVQAWIVGGAGLHGDGACLQGDGAGPPIAWRRSRGFLAQVSFYRWDLRRKCGFCAFQWRRTPLLFRTCAMMPRYLRRTVGGPAPYRGGGFRVPRLFNAAALFSVSLSVPPLCAPLRPSSLCPSASLRSVLLCGPLRPSALFSRRPSALRHAGEGGNADADFGAEGFEECFRAGRQGGAGGVDVVDQEDVAGKVVESGRAVKSGGVVES